MVVVSVALHPMLILTEVLGEEGYLGLASSALALWASAITAEVCLRTVVEGVAQGRREAQAPPPPVATAAMD